MGGDADRARRRAGLVEAPGQTDRAQALSTLSHKGRGEERASLTRTVLPLKTSGKAKGGTHVQGSVFAEGPRRAGDGRVAWHRQDDRRRISRAGRGEGLHHGAQGGPLRSDREGTHGRL